MFWLRNKKNNFLVRTLIWRPVKYLKILVIRIGIHEQLLLVRIANREEKKPSYLSLHCFSGGGDGDF